MEADARGRAGAGRRRGTTAGAAGPEQAATGAGEPATGGAGPRAAGDGRRSSRHGGGRPGEADSAGQPPSRRAGGGSGNPDERRTRRAPEPAGGARGARSGQRTDGAEASRRGPRATWRGAPSSRQGPGATRCVDGQPWQSGAKEDGRRARGQEGTSTRRGSARPRVGALGGGDAGAPGRCERSSVAGAAEAYGATGSLGEQQHQDVGLARERREGVQAHGRRKRRRGRPRRSQASAGAGASMQRAIVAANQRHCLGVV
nr:translation initiation factor IF-2-like [Aegilops tauschii subsp. strangulata]